MKEGKTPLHDVRVDVGIQQFLHEDDKKIVVQDSTGEEFTFIKVVLAVRSQRYVRRVQERLDDVRVGARIQQFLHENDKKIVVRDSTEEEFTFIQIVLAVVALECHYFR